MGKIKVAFMGSRPLASRCLKFLTKQPNVEVVGVVTFPKDYKGWWEGNLAIEAEKMGLPLKTEAELLSMDIDLVISVLYFRILKEPLISKPRLGCVNLHQAPLPRYRGCNTISHSIRNARVDGFKQYGTTFHYIDPGIDTGPIIKVAWVDIEDGDTGYDLYRKTEDISYDLFVEILPKLLSGKITKKDAQPQGKNTYYYPRTSLANKQVDLSWDPDTVWDFVRSIEFPPFEPAWIKIGNRKFYLTTKPYGPKANEK